MKLTSHPLFWLALLGAGLNHVAGNQLAAQPATTSVPEQEWRANDVQALHNLARRMGAHIISLPGYAVEVTQTWEVQGTQNASGTNQFRLASHPNGEFRLEIGIIGGPETTRMVCTGDGNQITRVLHAPQGTVHSIHPGGLPHLLDDGLTESSLRHSGMDLIAEPQPERYLMTIASDIQYLGEKNLKQGAAHHFRMILDGDPLHGFEIWISSDDHPLVLKTAVAVPMIPTTESQGKLMVSTELEWKKVDAHPEGHFQAVIPDDSRQVTDLQSHLIEGFSSELIGKPAPQVALKTLDGANWTLADSDKIVILYFFASWALPSHLEKQQLLDMIDEFATDDLVLFGINVGESPETVRSFVKAEKYKHSIVLDPLQEATIAFGITSLPTVVLINREGRVVTSHVGNTAAVRADLHSDIQQLMPEKNQ